jgi:hypothetical protein
LTDTRTGPGALISFGANEATMPKEAVPKEAVFTLKLEPGLRRAFIATAGAPKAKAGRGFAAFANCSQRSNRVV